MKIPKTKLSLKKGELYSLQNNFYFVDRYRHYNAANTNGLLRLLKIYPPPQDSYIPKGSVVLLLDCFYVKRQVLSHGHMNSRAKYFQASLLMKLEVGLLVSYGMKRFTPAVICLSNS